MGEFFRTLPKNIVGSFVGMKIIFFILAAIATYAIVQIGTDWRYLLAVRDPDLNRMFFPALVLGGVLPVSLPLFLIFYGWMFEKQIATHAGWALGQAALIGSLISSALKAFTGRVHPNIYDLAVDSSHNFQFGFLEHGIFWGWPSSHTTIAFAMAVTLILLFPKHRHIVFYAVVYALYIGIGVSLEIHWLSEFVAGAFIGTAIGLTVGASFRKSAQAK